MLSIGIIVNDITKDLPTMTAVGTSGSLDPGVPGLLLSSHMGAAFLCIQSMFGILWNHAPLVPFILDIPILFHVNTMHVAGYIQPSQEKSSASQTD